MLVTQQFKEDSDVKNNVQLALSELFNSTDPEIKQWAEDFAVYMFYVSGGTDSNAGGIDQNYSIRYYSTTVLS